MEVGWYDSHAQAVHAILIHHVRRPTIMKFHRKGRPLYALFGAVELKELTADGWKDVSVRGTEL